MILARGAISIVDFVDRQMQRLHFSVLAGRRSGRSCHPSLCAKLLPKANTIRLRSRVCRRQTFRPCPLFQCFSSILGEACPFLVEETSTTLTRKHSKPKTNVILSVFGMAAAVLAHVNSALGIGRETTTLSDSRGRGELVCSQSDNISAFASEQTRPHLLPLISIPRHLSCQSSGRDRASLASKLA